MIKDFVKRHVSKASYEQSKRLLAAPYSLINRIKYIYKKILGNRLLLIKNKKKDNRCLEIGPGSTRVAGFETVNIIAEGEVDYVYNASRRLPFQNDTFNIIYCSHILEHIPWYETKTTLAEWFRILKPGGKLEVWLPDGLKIAKAFVDAEEGKNNDYQNDNWYRFNPDKDPCIWAAGRIYTRGDGRGTLNHPNWHRALFSERYLKKIFEEVGFSSVKLMDRSEVRGYDHGWINLGVQGIKK